MVDAVSVLVVDACEKEGIFSGRCFDSQIVTGE